MRYNHRMRYRIITCALAAAVAILGSPADARAGRILTGAEIWGGAGALEADYRDNVLASTRFGAGLRFVEYIGIGGSFQIDKEKGFVLAYVGVYPARSWFIKPFGRFDVGSRTDSTGETALGWTAGVEMGERTMNVYLAYSGITTPGQVDAVNFGLIFNSFWR